MTTFETPSATAESTEHFAGRMMEAIDSASVAILVSIGHQTGLFDTMAALPPATSAQIADAAGLDERYVREWLGGVVTGRVVDYDPEAADVQPARATRRGADPRRRSRQPGPGGAVRPHGRGDRAEDHRLLPRRRRPVLHRISPVPRR